MTTTPRDVSGHSATPRALERDVGATLAVMAFSLAVAAGFVRVFSGWEFIGDLAVVVVVGHGVGLLNRRLGLTAWISIPAIVVALMWLIAWRYYPDTFSWGLPTAATWDVFTLELTGVRDQFPTAVAPVVYGAGWDVLSAIGVAIAVLLADVFAFRAFARAETLVPGGVLFVFVGALGDDRLRVASAVVVVAVGVVTAAVLRAYDTPTSERHPTSRVVWPAVAALAVVIAAIAGFVGPRLPGAEAAPLYDTRGRSGGVTEVLSPLVDIRSRLTNRSDLELFQVRATAESYWRSSALPEFDGTTWSLPERRLRTAGSSLSTPRAGAIELRQQITINELGGSLVPAAPDPFQASGPSDLKYDADTSTLVTVGSTLQAGDVIDVVSATPRFDPAALDAATTADSGDPIYTSLPDDLPDVVARTATEVTAAATSSYQAAILLQDWFRTNFTYSLEVQAGHGNNAIQNFLRDRIGYCEQFAGTFAAMMRTLDIPSRVAVGFTPGVQVSPGVYSVLGKNAHAWPEVWFDGLGWVPFEPTPGRGAPGAESYTGVAAQQDTSGLNGGTGGNAQLIPATTIPRGAIDQQFDPNVPDEFADPTGAGAATEPITNPGGSGTAVWLWALLGALAIATAVPTIVRRRRHPSGSAEHQLARMWARSVDNLADAGVPVAPSQTPLETAAAAKTHFPIVSRPVALLADAITQVTYRPEGASGFDVVGEFGSSPLRNCRHWTRQIDRAVHESSSLPDRIRRHFTDWG